MVGDIMQHGQQLKASIQPDGTYSWRGVFEPVAPVLRGADLAIANLETPVDPEQHYGGYPTFNAPPAILQALSSAGFDVLQTANNHVLDRDRAGVLATLQSISEHGFLSAGTNAGWADRAHPWVTVELPGPVRVGFLSYTYGTNGRPMPAGEPWLVNWIDDGFVQQDIQRARAQVDIVIVGLHWGGEYQHKPTPGQRDFARRLIEAGADVVMGTHPHVLQPAEVVSTNGRDGLILYSLGNFVSNQRTFPRDGGVMARVTIQTCVDFGSPQIAAVSFTPVWVDAHVSSRAGRGEQRAYRVVPVPPPGAVCGGLDLTVSDCEKMVRFREHAATLLPEEQFRWSLAHEPPNLPSLRWLESPPQTPTEEGAVWPVFPLFDTQARP